MRNLMEKLGDVGRVTMGLIGVIVLSLSAFVLTFVGIELAAEGLQFWGPLLWASGVSAGIFGVTGLALFIRAMTGTKESQEKRQRRTRQQDILDLAKENGGRITVPEIALKTSYSIEEASNQLDNLVERGIAELGITDQGREMYMFPDLCDKTKKLTADEALSHEIEAYFNEAANKGSGDGTHQEEREEDVAFETVSKRQ